MNLDIGYTARWILLPRRHDPRTGFSFERGFVALRMPLISWC